MGKILSDLPDSKNIIESPYTLDFIRSKLSGTFEQKIQIDGSQLVMLELILCLSNEIHSLKEEVKQLKSDQK